MASFGTFSLHAECVITDFSEDIEFRRISASRHSMSLLDERLTHVTLFTWHA